MAGPPLPVSSRLTTSAHSWLACIVNTFALNISAHSWLARIVNTFELTISAAS
jgi:hypothetical protein